jgi:transcriptional regulator with XRE-family HTH domain
MCGFVRLAWGDHLTKSMPARDVAPTPDAIALKVREEIARRRWSRQTVADKAGISLSTLEKALSGRRPFTLATVVRLETVFAMALRAPSAAELVATTPGVAPDELGSYNRAAVAWLEGAHLTLRPSFGDPKAIYAYRTDIAWDPAANRLSFREAERVDTDFTQFGTVAVPHQSGHIYLVTNRHGQHRLVVVAKPSITGEMHGILTTLLAGRGSHLSPVSTPIVLKAIGPNEKPAFGKITAGHDSYATYARLVRRTVVEDYAKFLT